MSDFEESIAARARELGYIPTDQDTMEINRQVAAEYQKRGGIPGRLDEALMAKAIDVAIVRVMTARGAKPRNGK